MNANMKRLLIFALVPVTVWGIGSTFTKQKIDRIGVNTESQITMEDTTRFNSGTASTVPYLDANKDFVSSSVTPTELGYLSGVTSSIQTQIDSKQTSVSGTANEIDVAADIIGLADNPILPGIEGVTIPSGATGDRPVSPNVGEFRWNTDNTEAEIYDGTQWGSVGGGAGGSRLNLLDDPSFEKGVTNGSCTGCTASQDTTDYLATPNNEASLKMAFSAASGNYTWTKSTSAQYSNVAGVVSAWIKTSASDCHFDELVNGVQSQTVAIGSSDEWKQYIINGTTGTTSYGWRVRCDTAITDDVFVDETFAGASEPDTFNIGTASLWGSVRWGATTNCIWSGTSSSFAAFSADPDCDDNARTIKGMYNSTNGAAGNSDGQLPQVKFSYIPAGTLRCELKGFAYTGAAGSSMAGRFSDGTDATVSSVAYTAGASNDLATTNSYIGEFNYTTAKTSETTISFQYDVGGGTIAYLQNNGNNDEELEISCYHYPAPQKVVAAKCDGLECENEFSARITSGAIVTSESTDFIASAATGASCQVDVTFQSGIFNTVPAITCTTESSAQTCGVTNESTTGFTYTTYDVVYVEGCNRQDVSINVSRQGSDYNQFDQRFIPVTDRTTEGFYVYKQGSFWDASTDTDEWDWSLSVPAFSSSQYISVTDVSGQTRISNTFGEPLEINIQVISTSDINGAVIIYDSSGQQYAQAQQDTGGGYNSSTSANFVLSSSDYFYIRNTDPTSGADGGLTLNVKPANLKAFIGNLTPKEFVQTPGSTKPVMYSAFIGTGGVVAKETGNWIQSCTGGVQNSVCTLEPGAFSSEPNCVINATGTGNATCEVQSYNGTTGFTIRCFIASSGADFTTTTQKTIICHGVQ